MEGTQKVVCCVFCSFAVTVNYFLRVAHPNSCQTQLQTVSMNIVFSNKSSWFVFSQPFNLSISTFDNKQRKVCLIRFKRTRTTLFAGFYCFSFTSAEKQTLTTTSLKLDVSCQMFFAKCLCQMSQKWHLARDIWHNTYTWYPQLAKTPVTLAVCRECPHTTNT